MEKKNRAPLKVDFDLTNAFEKTVHEFFYKMYHGYKKKFIVACARQYMHMNSDEIKEMLDKLEFNPNDFNINLGAKMKYSPDLNNHAISDKSLDALENEVKNDAHVAQNNSSSSSKLFKKM